MTPLGQPITRRQFGRLLASWVYAVALPPGLSRHPEPEPYAVCFDEDVLAEAISLGECELTGDQWGFRVQLDVERTWQAVSLMDQEGNVWRTTDEGRTWLDESGQVLEMG